MGTRVSGVYIAKNEEEFLPYSIRSILGSVDEVIVLDNDSTDATVESVISIPKVTVYHSNAGNFADLWNTALSKATGDWVLLSAADEVYYEDFAAAIPGLIEIPGADGYWVWYYHLMRSFYYMQNESEFDPPYRRIPLFRRTPDLHVEGAVHEKMVGLGPNIIDSGFHFAHYGYTKPCVEILKRWRLYARLEGKDDGYEGIDAEHLLDDRPIRPFRRPHPVVIQDHIERTARKRAASGERLFIPAPADPEETLC